MKNYLPLLLLIFLSCKNNTEKVKSAKIENSRINAETESNNSDKSVEHFEDSLTFGKKNKTKIIIDKYETNSTNLVEIKVFKLENKKWIKTQTTKFTKDPISNLDVKIQDFNNDKFNDLTLISDIAARGANELRTLFIYDPNNVKIIKIINSNEFPNLQYNKKLNCIDSWALYGGSSTTFLKLKGNKLVEFANIEEYEGIKVTEYDSNGKGTIIYYDSLFENEEFTRYETYKQFIKK